MSRTHDLVLARLRLLAIRWRGERAPGDRASDPRSFASEGSSDPRLPELPPARGAHADRVAPEVWLGLLGIVVVVALALAAAMVARSWPRPTPATPPATGQPAAPLVVVGDPFATTEPSPSPSLVVHVVGAVRRPGIVVLPAGSRVADAVAAAGGLRRGGKLGSTNLARLLADGERIDIGADGPGPAADGEAAGETGSATIVDLNTATAEQLDTLPGVGPVTAAKILAWRGAHGRFSVVDELAEVPGIGPKTLEDLRPHVRV